MLTGRSGTDPVRTVDLGVTGMTCGHCERRVVKALKAVEGVADASADARSGKAQVTLNSTGRDGKAFRAALDSAIEAAGYGTGSPAPQAESRDKLASYAAGLGLAGAFALAEALGLFHSVPATDGSAAPAALLVIGLLTGLHCVSMCGGIALSQGMKGLPSSGPSSASALAPSVAYNAGRVVSYTLIGALAGALGGVLDLGSRGRAFIMAAAGLFMILMGLRLVGILPQARIRLPFLHRLGARAGAFASNSGPFAVGIANGFMPCGPLQAMQVYALSAGGAAAGALSMFLFSLGTVPVLLAFGAGGAFLPHRLREGAVRAGAVLVAFLGITTLGRAWALSGLESPTVLLRAQSITAVEAPTGLARAPASTGMAARAGAPVVARRIGDYQVVEFDLAPRRYSEFVVQAGVPVRWVIRAGPNAVNGCNSPLVVPSLGIQKTLEVGENVIDFTPGAPGTVPYSCWMGMIRSRFTVVADISTFGPASGTQSPLVVPAIPDPAGTPAPGCPDC